MLKVKKYWSPYHPEIIHGDTEKMWCFVPFVEEEMERQIRSEFLRPPLTLLVHKWKRERGEWIARFSERSNLVPISHNFSLSPSVSHFFPSGHYFFSRGKEKRASFHAIFRSPSLGQGKGKKPATFWGEKKEFEKKSLSSCVSEWETCFFSCSSQFHLFPFFPLFSLSSVTARTK